MTSCPAGTRIVGLNIAANYGGFNYIDVSSASLLTACCDVLCKLACVSGSCMKQHLCMPAFCVMQSAYKRLRKKCGDLCFAPRLVPAAECRPLLLANNQSCSVLAEALSSLAC